MSDRRFLWLGFVLLAGCASAGNVGPDANASRFERQLGTGSANDINLKADKILGKYQFEIQQRSLPPNIYIETKWRRRRPFADEEALGVTVAETRAIVRGKTRGTTASLDVYTVNLTIENRVQREGADTWYSNVATPEYQRFANLITSDLKYELEIGVRR